MNHRCPERKATRVPSWWPVNVLFLGTPQSLQMQWVPHIIEVSVDSLREKNRP